ncbi:MAG TPA: cyclase family protein [Sedimentisphaerales bacterium]|nr:cyclase family protein [Sedimentisphaerales bacterium]
MTRIIDLTVPLETGLTGFTIEPARTLEHDGWNAATLGLYSHCGTHMDAPLHFGVSDETIDQIPLHRCMGPAWVADLTGIEPRALIGVGHLGRTKDNVCAGDGLLLRTGWSRHIGNPSYRDALPRVSIELARWCIEKGVRLLGVEPPSIADVNNIEELTAVHTVLLGAGVIVVEGLANLDQIGRDKVTFMAFPLRIVGGDGSPVRAIAIEP